MSLKGFGEFRLSEIGAQSISDSDGLLTRPMEMPIATMQRMYYVRPLRVACNAVVDVMLEAFFAMTKSEAFYREEGNEPPDEDDRWSHILCGASNGTAKAIDDLIAALKLYKPDETPCNNLEPFRKMRVCISQMIAFLKNVFGDRATVFEHCWTIYTSAIASLDKSPSVAYTVEQRNRDVERLRDAYKSIDWYIADFLLKYENGRIHPKTRIASAVQAEQIVNIANDMNRKVDSVQTTVKRIDRRDLSSRGDARKQKNAEKQRIQDEAFAVFEQAKNDVSLKQQMINGHVTFVACFNIRQYRDRLLALGITTPDELRKVIGARSDRIHRENRKRMENETTPNPLRRDLV